MQSFPLHRARERLAPLFGTTTDAEIDHLIASLRLIDEEMGALCNETCSRATVRLVHGVTLQEFPPRFCLTAQLYLGDLSVHLSVTCPRYFVGAVDDLWRVQVEAYLSCGHEEHDIDPVLELPTRTATTPVNVR